MEHISSLKEAIDAAYKDEITQGYLKLAMNIRDSGSSASELANAKSTFKRAIERALDIRNIALKEADIA
jgi:hypothetical protein